MSPTERVKQRKPIDELGPPTPIVDRKAVLAGVIISAGLLVFAILWKLAPNPNVLGELQDFEFTVAEPDTDEFELEDPIREIIKERPEEQEMQEVEAPNIQIATVPTEVVEQDIVKSINVQIDAPEIDVLSDEIEIQDTPFEISETSEDVQFALDAIAADVAEPADIFKYEDPIPPDKPRLFTINRAPQPNRTLSVLPKAFGDQEAPSLGRLGPIDVNLFGTGDFLPTMERSGGAKAKASVDAALQWLAAHQEPSGIWKTEKYEGTEPGELAATGLAVLALMGGGHTTRKGEYRRNVLRGVEEIMRHQRDSGLITSAGANLYTHAICSIALCEAYGRANDPRIGTAAQKAVKYIEYGVNTDGGWRYTPRGTVSDLSVTAWFIQALKTAKLARIEFDSAIYSQALAFLDSVTDQGASRDSSGAIGYTFSTDQRIANSHPALTAAGMLIRQFTGTGVRNHLLVKGANLTRTNSPRWQKKDFYLWYYATYAMHNMGGEHRLWWNQRIRNVLLEHQSRQGDNAGSWDPEGAHWGEQGGRVYTTALGALCLEVYYRYSEALNSFGTAPDLDELFLE